MKLKATRKVMLGQSSWHIRSSTVEAFLTEQGGHLGPVTFDRRGRKLQPYSVAPWAEEEVDKSLPTILKVLRGDFFCMPFGGNAKPFGREKHPVHGETANARWKLESMEKTADRTTLHVSLDTKVRKGRVDKRIMLIDGHYAVYSQHVVSGMSGPMNLGHHAMIKFPDEPGSGLLSVSPFKLGRTFYEPTENPADRGYSILKPDAEFRTLRQVPTITGETADLSRYPSRRGFEDIVEILADPKRNVAWTAISFPRQRFVWFALKDPRVLAGTVMWISNGGRHYPPWNGRHVNVMGLEEVTSYFHGGLAESARKNAFTRLGFPTTLQLKANKPLVVNYIMAAVPAPAGFSEVKRIETAPDHVVLVDVGGKKVKAAIDMTFLQAKG